MPVCLEGERKSYNLDNRASLSHSTALESDWAVEEAMGSVGTDICMGRSLWGACKGDELEEGC